MGRANDQLFLKNGMFFVKKIYICSGFKEVISYAYNTIY